MNTSNHTVRTAAFGAATALMLSIASTAVFAGSAPYGTKSITVSYGELDLSKPAGAQVLYRRIERAAVTVCNDNPRPYSEMRTKRSTCYRDAVANAVAEVNSEQLFEIYQQHMTRIASN
jgi:UrcA family protein